MDKLTEFKQSWAKIENKYKEIKGNGPVSVDEQNKLMEYMWEAMSGLRNMVWDLYDENNAKINNHINPPGAHHPMMLKTASHVQNYCDACGMGEDVEIIKPKIQVKSSRNGNKEFNVELHISEKQGVNI